MNKKIKKIASDVKNVAVDCLQVLPEILTPEIITDPHLVIVKIARKMGSFYLTKFGKEYNERRAKNEIKNTDFKTEKPMLFFNDLLKTIDKGNLEEERFRAMKSIFFSGISKDSTQQDEVLAYEFMQTAKKLNGTEILILKANFEITKENISKTVSEEALKNGKSRRAPWRAVIVQQMGSVDFDGVIIRYEKNLELLGLISPRIEDTRFPDDFVPTQKFRLTNTGYKFCEFITNYE